MSADNAPDNTGGTPPSAGGDGLLIPKHRLDEVLQENRRLKEEQGIKDSLYLQERQRATAAQPKGPTLASAEDLGLDPQTYKAVSILAQQISGHQVAQREQQFQGMFGQLAERTEKAELLAAHGADKARYIPEIRRLQREHAETTGGYLPAEVAMKLINSDEKDSEISRLRAQIAGQGGQGVIQQPQVSQARQGVPSGQGTSASGGAGGAAGGVGKKSFGEMTVEEMEATLSDRFRGGDVL